jgi:tripartite-type tricarboxylate transporter receptor subunit TctC
MNRNLRPHVESDPVHRTSPSATGGVALLAPLLATLALSPDASAQEYPQKPIRLIVLSSPASGPDIVGRLVGSHLTGAWGQQVVVDARPGASGIIGAEIAAKAAPDGHTLVIATAQAAIVTAMFEKLPYDLNKDFSPITLMASTPFLLVVNPSVKANSVAELIALAKGRPGDLRYGSGGSGSPPHLSAEIFSSMTGIQMRHVPYKGVTPALTDTISGEVHMVISVVPAVLASIRSGRVRALGITSAKRSPIVPEVPTISETVPGYEFIGWYALLAPARTPAAIIDKLNAEVAGAMKTPGIRDRLADLGAEPIGSTVSEVARFIPEQIDKMRAAVKASGAKPDR